MSSITDRLRSVLGDGEEKCRHEREDIWPDRNHDLWHQTSSTVHPESYWCERDAAFTELRSIERELRCLGCGEVHTIKSAEPTSNVQWKADMTTDELAEMREQVNCGSWTNGQLWWEKYVWDSDPAEVETPLDRSHR